MLAPTWQCWKTRLNVLVQLLIRYAHICCCNSLPDREGAFGRNGTDARRRGRSKEWTTAPMMVSSQRRKVSPNCMMVCDLSSIEWVVCSGFKRKSTQQVAIVS